MKTLVKMLGAVAVTALVTACGPDMKTINSASERAEADAPPVTGPHQFGNFLLGDQLLIELDYQMVDLHRPQHLPDVVEVRPSAA